MPREDWTQWVDRNIPDMKNKTVLEFGLGDSTEYLLQNFRSVYSHELAKEDYWYRFTTDKFKSYQNWEHELILWKEIGFVDYNPVLPDALKENIRKLLTDLKFDVILMDGGYHVRGDILDLIINEFLPEWVVFHDTFRAFEIDGYGRMNIPYCYERFETKEGEGTIILKRKTN